MFEITNLEKTYSGFALGPLSLSVEAGCVLGLVGANGAGKTTMFRCIMGTVRQQGGSVFIDNSPIPSNSGLWRRQIGYVGDSTPLFEHWTGYKNLSAFARFYPEWSHARAEAIASKLKLDLSKRVKSYSTGQRSKFAITLALSHGARLLLLDEPTAGLDPLSRDCFQDLLFEAMEPGDKAMIYATHHVSEIENLVDRLAFIEAGKVIRQDVKEDLNEAWRHISFRHEGELESIPHTFSYRSESPYQEVISDNAAETLNYLRARGVEGIESSRLPLERIAIEILKSASWDKDHV